MDSLVELPRSDLPKVREVFTNNWPYGLEGYCLLNVQLSRPTLLDIAKFKFYAPEGDISLGIVAISDKSDYYVIYICPADTIGLTALENAIEHTNVIDWSRKVTVASANPDVFECLKRLCAKLDLKITDESKANKHLLNKDAKSYGNLEPPENTYVGALKPEFLDLVNQTWTFYSGQRSYEHFETLMQNGLTYVLYSSEDNKPVAWITIDITGEFTHLFCVEGHRGKGYAEYITKVATNDWLSQGNHVLAYTLEENIKPQKLFNKLGFEFIGHVWWVCLTSRSK